MKIFLIATLLLFVFTSTKADDGVVGGATNGANGLVDGVLIVVKEVTGLIGDVVISVADGTGKAVDTVIGAVEPILSSIGDCVTSALAKVGIGVPSIFTSLNRLLRNTLGPNTSNLPDTGSSGQGSSLNPITVAPITITTTKVAAGGLGGLGDALGGLTDGLGDTLGGLTDGLGGVTGGLGDVLGGVTGGLGDALGGVGDLLGGLLDPETEPGLAGSVVKALNNGVEAVGLLTNNVPILKDVDDLLDALL